jgi:hypothetical protein
MGRIHGGEGRGDVRRRWASSRSATSDRRTTGRAPAGNRCRVPRGSSSRGNPTLAREVRACVGCAPGIRIRGPDGSAEAKRVGRHCGCMPTPIDARARWMPTRSVLTRSVQTAR